MHASWPGADVCRGRFALSAASISHGHCRDPSYAAPHHAYCSSRTGVGSRVASGASRARLFSANLPDLRASLPGSAASGLGEDASSSPSRYKTTGTEVVMDTHALHLTDGTAALSPASQIEAEFAKDRWDARNIPGLQYAPHNTHYWVNFLHVPQAFRSVVKNYARFKFTEGRVAQTLQRAVYCVGHFLTFFVEHSPSSTTLHGLSTHDVDRFIVFLKATAKQEQLKDTFQYLQSRISYLEEFLCYLDLSQDPIRPSERTARLIWPHHYPKGEPVKSTVKYLPHEVLSPLDAHLQHLPPACIPIVILLRASGWRISDILYLKRDTYLEQNADQFCLVGDIQKTRTLGHRIPITGEVAAVVQTQIVWVKEHYTLEENPKGWLFPASKRNPTSHRFVRRDPRGPRGIRSALDDLTTNYHIRAKHRELLPFGPHAVRHKKAVELINNGMSLMMVQQWLAHASPEMTLIYARILDETMRTQWEKTVQQGLVHFNA